MNAACAVAGMRRSVRRAEKPAGALDAKVYRELRCLKGHKASVWGIAVSQDGKRALSGSRDNTVRLWDLDTGKELRCFVGHKDAVCAVALTPDGKQLLTGSADETVLIGGRRVRQENPRLFRGMQKVWRQHGSSKSRRQARSVGRLG